VYKLFVHDSAKGDLEDLWHVAPQAAARIAVVLQELEGNQDLLDRLTQHDFGAYGSGGIHVSKWLKQWNRGKDLWRVKIWDLEEKGLRYRIVYAFIPGKKHYHVLAIAPRNFNYDPHHELTRRILRDYGNL
jgi:hypothetical protein